MATKLPPELEEAPPTGRDLRALRELARWAWKHPLYGFALRAVLGYLVLVEGAIQLFFGQSPLLGFGFRGSPIPRGVFFNGIVIGTLYALVAMGLILVYRANRIINFAQAQLGAIPAVLALLLLTRQDWPYLAVVPIVVVGGALLGGVVEVGFVRRFQSSSRLTLTVVTIGVGFLLLVLEFFTKLWIGGNVSHMVDFPTPFQGYEFTLGLVRFSGDHIVAIVVAGALVAALAAFFQFTDLGIAVRAAAENAARAALLGIPVARVSTIVWILAGTLSAVGIFLRGPLIGIPIVGFVGPSILLFGLAAAVMARMERLPMALLAGMFVGIVDQSVLFSTGRAAMASGVILIVILAALLLQRAELARAFQVGGNWEMVKNYRPIPTELRALPEVATARRALGIGVAVLALTAPFLFGAGGAGFATLIVLFSMVGLSLVVLTGWSGQISLGQFAFAGVGAAVAGGMAANHNADFFVTLAVAGLAGAIVALLVGLPALRIQGLFLAVTTLAFAFAVQQVVLNREYAGWLLPSELAFVEPPLLYGRFDLSVPSEVGPLTFSPAAKLYYVALILLLLTVGVVKSLRRNRSGRLFMGVRDNPRLMEAFGVSTVHTRLVAFAVSGAIAALAGALLAYDQATVDAGTFTPERSIQVFVMTVIGGIGSVGGAILGAVFVLGVPRLPGVRQLALVELLTSGLGVLIILYFLPGGLTEGAYRLRDRYLRWVAARHDIHVPSLIADSLVDTADDDAIVAAAEGDPHLPRGGESGPHAESSGEAEPVAVGDGPGAEDEGQWS
jgi:branched-chain amino acid transport system permease protein